MRFFYITVVLCLLIITSASAQSLVRGRVMEFKTRIAIAGTRVENPATGQTSVTDNKGDFSIKAKRNDVLVFSAYSYKPDTVVVTDFNAKEVFLQPLVLNLKEVTIRNTQDVKIATMKDPDFHGQTMSYQLDENGFRKGGVSLRMHLNNSEEKKRQKEQDLQHTDDVANQIAKVFTPENIAKYVPLKGQELDDFIEMYRPSVKQYTAADFNLTTYLNACYKAYQQLPPEKRHPVKLNG